MNDYHGCNVVVHQSGYPTFSFINPIYLAAADIDPEASRKHILIHEASHIRGAHSMDILAIEILKIVFWVNPMVYLYKNALILSHEFIADRESVIKNDQQNYVNLLVDQTLTNLGLSLGSHFGWKSGILSQWPWANGLSLNKSQTLKRIKMIKNKSKMNKLKYLIPVVAILLSAIIVSCVEDENSTEITDQVSEVNTKEPVTNEVEVKEEVFQLVDEAPRYTGGDNEMYKYLGKSINYPTEARQKGVEGRVFVQFIINRDGSVSDVQTLKGIGAGCDEEAVRVVESMPAWIPGVKDGADVNVRMVLPIFFKIKGSNAQSNSSSVKSDKIKIKDEIVVVGYPK
ncbi:MAG: M56 family metallopeptidase [Cyclobacteriaceae bacterium]